MKSNKQTFQGTKQLTIHLLKHTTHTFLLICLFFSLPTLGFGQNIIKTRTIEQTTHCNGGEIYSFYMNLPGSSSDERFYQIQNGQFIEYDNGTAQITGLAVNNSNNNHKWRINVTLADRTFEVNPDEVKEHKCNPTDVSDWYLYNETTGTFTGEGYFQGAVATMYRRGPAFQLGTDGNETEVTSRFNGCGWHHIEFSSQPNNGTTLEDAVGDLNLNLTGSTLTEEETCTGEIVSFKITNDVTSITLQDGGSYQIGDLPANSTIEAVATGSHESIGFNVNGAENEENTVPYDHYWTPAVGTYTISASLFNEDNCSGIKCDEKTITITITDNPVTCTGEIAFFSIANDENSITLEDGGSYRIGDLPANATIRAVATGSHESIGFNVNGAENEENTVPYEHYWTPAVGSYTISASLFNEDNCSGIKCDEKTITITITNNLLPHTNVCVKYQVSDSKPECGPFPDEHGVFFRRNCNPTTEFEVWKAGNDLILEERGNGTAVLTGSVYNGTTVGIVNIEYWELSSTGTNWNNQCYNDQMVEEYFYTHFEGSINIDGEVFTLIEKGAGTVFGAGANNVSTGEFGFGGWLDGTWGNCVESFGKLTPILPGSTCDDGDNNTINDVIQPDGCTCSGEMDPCLDEILVTVSSTDVNCGSADGSITFTFQDHPNRTQVAFSLDGGTTWETNVNDNQGSVTYDGLVEGNYDLMARWGNTECPISLDPVTISSAISELTCQAEVSQILTSVLVNDATATATANGTYSPYSYLWSNGQTTATATNLEAGDYTVTITDNKGCQCISNVTIDGVAAIGNFVWADTNNNGIQDTGEPGISNIVVMLLDGNGNMVSQTTTDQNGQYIFDGLAPGNYKVKFPVTTNTNGSDYILTTPNNGDETKDSDAQPMPGTNDAMTEIITLNIGDNYKDLDAGYILGCSNVDFDFSATILNDVTCNNNNDGQIDLSITGETAPYSYNWSNGAISEDLNNLAPGNYTVTVTDDNGCEGTYSASIAEPTAINASANATNVACSGGDNGAVQITVDGGTAPYTYSWSNGETTQSINGLTAGSYSVTITDANNCTTTTSASVDQAGDLVIVVDQATNVSCNGDNDGAISISVSGGTAPYSFNWSNGSTTEDLTGLTAGEYTGNVTDANGCSIAATVTISEPDPINASANATNVACSGGDNGAVQITVDGGTAPYTYSWSNGATTQSINGLTAGSYSVTITDANNCSTTSSASVDQAGDLLVTVDQATNVSCNGDNDGAISISVSGGTAPYSFNWSNGSTTEDLTGLTAGEYTGNITDANGCSIAATVTISEPDPINASANATNVACSGGDNGAVQITVDGGTAPYTYSWSNGATTQSINGLTAGSYSVTITDANNCSTTSSASVDQAGDLLVTVDQATNVSCNGDNDGAISISVSGGTAPYSFNWSNGSTTEDLTGLTAGEYTGNITDANGCSIAATVTISEPDPINASANATNVACSGGDNGAVQITVDGGTAPYAYNWSNGKTTQSINGLTAGSYSVTITDANNCTTTTSASVDQAGDLIVAVDQATNVSCNGNNDGAISISVSGGTAPYSFNWSNGSTTEDLTGLTAGEYTGNITDANGCSIAATVTISEPDPINASANATNVACSGGDNGAVQITVDGGTAPYAYNWSNGKTTQSINGLTAGSYSVTITDANNCTTTTSASVDQAGDLIVAVDQATNVSCNGDNDGAISISVSGGTAPYSFNWSNGSTTEDLTGLTAGEYTGNITDANGCSIAATVTISEPDPINASANATNVACSGGDNGAVQITVDGGTAPYTYSWSNGATTQSINSLTAGSYSVTITDANNCSTTSSASVDQAGDLLVTVDQATNVSCNGDNDGAISVSVSGGTAPYSFNWSNGATTEDLTGLTAGEYTGNVTDANGCSIAATVTISEPDPINATANATNVACSGGDNGAVQITVDGGTAPYTYSWSNGATTQSINSLTAGSYSVTITDANNCSTTSSASVDQAGDLLVTVDQATNVSCNGDNDGAISVSVSGGTAPYSYNWSNGATTEDLTGLMAGEYTGNITDANGCSIAATVTISEPDPINATANATNVACSGGDNGAVQITVDGGTAPYTYSWSNGATTQSINSLTAGSYSVTITDANNCSTTSSASVDQAGDLLVTVDQATNVSCNGDNDGAISVSVSGGTAPYSFNWSNGATTEDLTGLTAGEYTGNVTDANGCSIAATVTISEPEILSGLLNIDNITCSGNNTGAIELSVSGGSAPYTYNWSNGATTRNLNNQGAGTYSVTITDAKDCVIELSGEILETAQLEIETQRIENVTCAGDTDGLIDITIVGGTSPYSFNWSNGASSEDISNLTSGSYQVTITDANGCQGFYENVISEPALLECKANILANLTTRGGSDASLLASALGGSAPFSYLWNTQQTTAEISNLSAGTYQVTITDNNGCQCETTIEINNPAKVGDYVWEDLNGDGIQNSNEPGIPNVEVTLTGIDANGENVTLTTSTDTNGQYDFDGLLPGTYKISFETPTNFTSTSANVGNDELDSDAQNGMTPDFTIEYGDEDLSFDAGFYNPVNIGNFVWFDANNNGIQDVNEVGVNGVIVSLFDLGPDETFGTGDDILVGTQTTQTANGADGNYQFTGVAPGKYVVKFALTDLSEEYEFTVSGASGNNVDSNVDPVTGLTETIMVMSGQADDNSIDAGLILACDVTAAFTTQQEFCEDELAQFTAEDSGAGATYEWVFFNGPSNTSTFIGTRSGYDVPFRFTSPGDKFVKLVVTLPNGCQAIEERVINVGGNITSGGTIGSDEESCGAFDPTIITNMTSPTGGNGNFEFLWMRSNQPTPPTSLQDPAWEIIPNANGLDYDPGMIEETTYFIRCSRMEYCTDYLGESNVVAKSVNGNLVSEFTTDDFICWNRPIEFIADLQAADATYQWLIFRGVDQTGTYLGAREGGTMEFNFSEAGPHYVQLQVSLPNGCTGTYGEELFVDGYSRICGDSIALMVVTALNFDAQPKDDGTVLLTWEISNEPTNVQYTVEHSTGEDDFEAIGNVKGELSENYEFVDDAPMFGINYYRLKYIYADGTIDFSDIKQVVMRFDDKQKVSVFPNPTQDITRLRLAEPDTEDVTLELITGQGITLEKVILPAGETDVEFDMTMYESGHYFIYMQKQGRKSLLSRVMKIND